MSCAFERSMPHARIRALCLRRNLHTDFSIKGIPRQRRVAGSFGLVILQRRRHRAPAVRARRPFAAGHALGLQHRRGARLQPPRAPRPRHPRGPRVQPRAPPRPQPPRGPRVQPRTRPAPAAPRAACHNPARPTRATPHAPHAHSPRARPATPARPPRPQPPRAPRPRHPRAACHSPARRLPATPRAPGAQPRTRRALPRAPRRVNLLFSRFGV